MIRKISTAIFLTVLLGTSLNADTLGNDRAEFSRRFSIMRQISIFCRSNNENTALMSLNSLRDILFRSHINPLGTSASTDDSPSGLIMRMNSDVKKIYTGILNLENSLKLSDPHDPDDKQMNELLQYLVVSEITLILNDDFVFRASEKTREFIRQARITIASLMSQIPENDTMSNFHAMDALENLMNLTEYIYNEQIQWLMNASYALQSLDVATFTINNESVFTGFNIKQPPAMYVNNTGEYNLR